MTPQIEIFYILLGVDCVVLVSNVLCTRKLYYLLQQKHPDKFEELGEPSLFMNKSYMTGLKVNKFLCSKDPLFLTDPELSKLRPFLVVFMFLHPIIFVTGLLLFFHINPKIFSQFLHS